MFRKCNIIVDIQSLRVSRGEEVIGLIQYNYKEFTMKNYEFILWDIDDTLIDFKKSESHALRQCFNQYDIQISDEDIAVYSKINQEYWEQLEEGLVVKKAMLVRRFEDFLAFLEVHHVSGEVINELYQKALGDHVVMFPGAYDLCKELHGVKKQYVVTNGTIVAQNKKLKNTGLVKFFDKIFISDEVGYQKPDVRFFNHCFYEIPNFDLNKAIIIGDSLTSDMKGALNAGIDSCWFNPNGLDKSDDIRVNYQVTKLEELRDIIL